MNRLILLPIVMLFAAGAAMLALAAPRLIALV